jgi:hypothetical protein
VKNRVSREKNGNTLVAISPDDLHYGRYIPMTFQVYSPLNPPLLEKLQKRTKIKVPNHQTHPPNLGFKSQNPIHLK